MMDFWLGFLTWILLGQLWVTVDVGGDFSLGRNLSKHIKKFGEVQFFRSLNSHLSQSDFSLCNLEGSVIPEKFSGSRVLRQPRFDLTFSRESADLLSLSGFRGFGLANNHSLDAGEGGFRETVAALKDLNLVPLLGWSEILIKGQPFAILALNYSTNPDRENREWTISFSSLAHRKRVFSEVAEKSKRFPVIVFLHGGREDSDDVTPVEQTFYRELIQSGADGVFGHHPHRMKFGGGFHFRPCYFSLGSVLFDRSRTPDCYGLMVRLHFWAGMLMKWSIDGVHLHPDNYRPVVWENSRFLSLSPFKELFNRSSYEVADPRFYLYLDYLGFPKSRH